MSSTESEGVDPLDFFHALETRKRPPKAEDKDQRTYPGSTPPRNQVLDTGEESWLNRLPFHEFDVGGVTQKFYTIGALASALGKQPVTIRSWERKGWLPKAKFRTPPPRGEQLPNKTTKGRRLYSQEQVVFLAEAYGKYVLDPRKPNWEGFRNHIKTQYPR